MNRRKLIRAQITLFYNDLSNFDDLTQIEQIAKKSALSFSNEIKKHDLEFQSLKAHDSSFSDVDMFREFKMCLEYQDKIHTILAGLELLVQSKHQPGTYWSGFKSSTLMSHYLILMEMMGEDLNKFLSCFKETVNKYSYSVFFKLFY